MRAGWFMPEERLGPKARWWARTALTNLKFRGVFLPAVGRAAHDEDCLKLHFPSPMNVSNHPSPTAEAADFSEITYVVDAEDRLVRVSPEWADFAAQNGGDGLEPDAVVGRVLWDFFYDELTQKLYRDVLAHVRAGAATHLVLRCDGPERRRLIEMTVTRLDDGSVEFKNVLLAAKMRPEQKLFNHTTPRTAERVKVCSWCDRVKSGPDNWSEVEKAMEELQLVGAAALPAVQPTVCPVCAAKVCHLLADPGV